MLSTEQRQAELEEQLFSKYGPFVHGKDLRLLLGYTTGAAFRQAVKHKRVPVPTFLLEGRQARRANTKDVATWIARVEARADAARVDLSATKIPPASPSGNDQPASDKPSFWRRLRNFGF